MAGEQTSEPGAARQAREEAADDSEQVTWVGEQRLMSGYCGRALVSSQDGADAAKIVRPVVLLGPQGKMRRGAMRIGPRIIGPDKEPPAEVGANDAEAA